MNYLNPGTVVYTSPGLAILLYECKEPPDYWAVLRRSENRITISRIPKSKIRSYKNVCWSCPASIDSTLHESCPICYWVKCPDCGACKKSACETGSVVIEVE